MLHPSLESLRAHMGTPRQRPAHQQAPTSFMIDDILGGDRDSSPRTVPPSASPERQPLVPGVLRPMASLATSPLQLYKPSSVYEQAALLSSPCLATAHLAAYPGSMSTAAMYGFPYTRHELALYDAQTAYHKGTHRLVSFIKP